MFIFTSLHLNAPYKIQLIRLAVVVKDGRDCFILCPHIVKMLQEIQASSDDSTSYAEQSTQSSQQNTTLQLILLKLEYFSRFKPRDESVYYGAWNQLLESRFSTRDGFTVETSRIIYYSDQIRHRIPDLSVISNKIEADELEERPILLVEVKKKANWGKRFHAKLRDQLMEQASAALGKDYQQIFYIAAIGSQWNYGSISRDSGLLCMTEWFDTIHGEDSLAGLDTLASLVYAELGKNYVAT